MKKLFGITVAMTTPFLEDAGVDYDAIAKHVEFLISKGVDCLYPGGTTGEMLRMTVEERKKMAETVVKTAAGRLPVFIQCGATHEKDTIELARHAESIGADGIGVVTPQYYGLNHRELVEHYVRVAGSVSLPVYLYCIPQCAANDITPADAQEITNRAKNVIGIKYSYADINKTLDYMKVNNYNFSVMHGCDRVYIAMKALGCDGTVSGISCVFPEPFVDVQQSILAGDWEAAKLHQRDATRVTDILGAGSNMSYFKEALKIRGLEGGHMRKPQLDITPDEVEKLRSELEQFCADTGYTLKVN